MVDLIIFEMVVVMYDGLDDEIIVSDIIVVIYIRKFFVYKQVFKIYFEFNKNDLNKDEIQ